MRGVTPDQRQLAHIHAEIVRSAARERVCTPADAVLAPGRADGDGAPPEIHFQLHEVRVQLCTDIACQISHCRRAGKCKACAGEARNDGRRAASLEDQDAVLAAEAVPQDRLHSAGLAAHTRPVLGKIRGRWAKDVELPSVREESRGVGALEAARTPTKPVDPPVGNGNGFAPRYHRAIDAVYRKKASGPAEAIFERSVATCVQNSDNVSR
jgi:hypothetical protein